MHTAAQIRASTNTQQIYGEVCLPLVGAMFRGGRSTCFAYGQTGARALG